MTSLLAGQPAPRTLLQNIPRLISGYYTLIPDPDNPAHQVAFGTSGHRGSSLRNSFNEPHILSISQAICDYRREEGIDGPLFLGMDTHALSEPAMMTAVEVLAANDVELVIQAGMGYTPTPVISHAILTYNRNRQAHLADGIVITPSHNPPEDGGFKYNPPNGGPADTTITKRIEHRANELLHEGLHLVKRLPWGKAKTSPCTHEYDFVADYVSDLKDVIDFDAIASAGLHIGVDPMGGAAISYWEPIAATYGIDLTVVNDVVDPAFGFMTVDHDGKIRMDCSSPYAMASLIHLKDHFDISFGNDPDVDRHGIVTRSAGLLNPNHYLAVAVNYLFQHRPGWRGDAAIGKTLVSSSMIDRVGKSLGRTLAEVPVGFKFFVDGLLAGDFGFGGEESAGASFLRRRGTVWTTDKDGITLALLAAEITAVTGKDPGEHYRELEERFGRAFYARVDAPANREQKAILATLSPEKVKAQTLAGESIVSRLTQAPYNQASIGGLKVVAENGWFAARPSGTEDVYKIYAESFISEQHLHQIQAEAQQIVSDALSAT